jgi:hypothetical protein
MKNRLSFCTNVGFGVLTNGIKTFHVIADCDLGNNQLNTRLLNQRTNQSPIGNRQSAMFLRPSGFAFRKIHQLDIAALRLQVEIPRAPIDARQQRAGYENTEYARSDHYPFAGGGQVQPAIDRFDRTDASPTI